jgi:agmatine deiminase
MKYRQKALSIFLVSSLMAMIPASSADYTMPDENLPHEGTWLQWPHHHTYGKAYRNGLDPTWVAMTKALVPGEKVHIIVYDKIEEKRVAAILEKARVPLRRVDFLIRRTDDVWVRDNGPIFVKDSNGRSYVSDWGFNGWGYDTRFKSDNLVPLAVAKRLRLQRIDAGDTVLEGGAFVMDGEGTLMATLSSILEPRRNPGLSVSELEARLSSRLGAKRFIWLQGAPGGKEDITDTHIDGFATFAPGRRLVTLSDEDLAYWGLPAADIDTLNRATDRDGHPYTKVVLPLTARNVVAPNGVRVGFKGSYVNYYVANKVVLMPAYSDPNDEVAKRLLQSVYRTRVVTSIDVRNLYVGGGMVHCVTQQQPR